MRDKLNSFFGAVFGGLLAGIAFAFTVGDLVWLYILWRTGQPIQDAHLQLYLLIGFVSLFIGARLNMLSMKRKRLDVSLKPGTQICLVGLLERQSGAPARTDGQGVLSLSDGFKVVLKFALDLVHQGQEGDVVKLLAKLDTDWPLLRAFGKKELQADLQYYTNPDGASGTYKSINDLLAARGHKTGTDLYMKGEQRLEAVEVSFCLKPDLGSGSDGFKALSGLTRLALNIQVVAGREKHKLRVEFDVRQVGRAVRAEVGKACKTMLDNGEKSGALPQQSEIDKYLDCLVDVYELPPRERASRWPWRR